MPSAANLNLAALCRGGRLKDALHILLTTHNTPVNSSTYLQLLQTCISKKTLSEGKKIHSHITERKFKFSTHKLLQNTLVRMYDRCGSLVAAREVFDQMTERDVFSWNIIIAAYRRHGYPHEALSLFYQMQRMAVQPDQFTFASVLPACAKCESIQKARELFDKMPEKDVVSWTAMITVYTQNGFAEKALEAFKQMQVAGVKPDSTTFASILPACAKMGALEQGIHIHQRIMEMGYLSDVIVANALIDMYAKCGSIHKARELFDIVPGKNVVSWNSMIAGYAQNGVVDEALMLFKEMPQRNVVSWNAMIGGYTQNGFAENAMETFKQMQLAVVKPVSTTFASILPACAKMGALEEGMDIHRRIIESGLLLDVVVVSALVDMYIKCGSIQKAHELFDKAPQRDVVSWTAMIAGYVQNGFFEKALETFMQMQLTGVKPNSTTFASILPACAKMGALKQGMIIHQGIIESGFLSDIIVVSALVDMYAKCGTLNKAHELFGKMPQRDVVSWTAMIAGYAQNGLVEKALQTFYQMQSEGIKPDSTTFSSILPACAKMGAIQQGIDIHQSIVERGLLLDVVVASALLDMYAKCGSIHRAREVFDKMRQRNVISWNAMMAGYAQNGFCKDALKLFELMKHSGTYPDHLSFTCVLLACSHAGLVDEGCKYFNSICDSYCIVPTIDHYVCMVDLLGRAGYLKETLNFIIKMPIKPVAVVWMCLLGACRPHKNIGLGVFTATHLFEQDPTDSTTYVLLSNIYAEVGRWGEVQMVRRLMNDKGIKKIPGCSWIEVDKIVHAFCVGDISHL